MSDYAKFTRLIASLREEIADEINKDLTGFTVSVDHDTAHVAFIEADGDYDTSLDSLRHKWFEETRL